MFYFFIKGSLYLYSFYFVQIVGCSLNTFLPEMDHHSHHMHESVQVVSSTASPHSQHVMLPTAGHNHGDDGSSSSDDHSGMSHMMMMYVRIIRFPLPVLLLRCKINYVVFRGSSDSVSICSFP